MKAKLRMYQCCVWSTLTYGNVTWKLTKETCKRLRNRNAKNVKRITGRHVYDENKVGPEKAEPFQLMMEQKPYEEGVDLAAN